MSVADAWVSGNSFRCVPVAYGNSCANVRHLPCLLHKYPNEKPAFILKTTPNLSLINHKIRCMNTKFIQRIFDFYEQLGCVCSEIYFRCVRGLGDNATNKHLQNLYRFALLARIDITLLLV